MSLWPYCALVIHLDKILNVVLIVCFLLSCRWVVKEKSHEANALLNKLLETNFMNSSCRVITWITCRSEDNVYLAIPYEWPTYSYSPKVNQFEIDDCEMIGRQIQLSIVPLGLGDTWASIVFAAFVSAFMRRGNTALLSIKKSHFTLISLFFSKTSWTYAT